MEYKIHMDPDQIIPGEMSSLKENVVFRLHPPGDQWRLRPMGWLDQGKIYPQNIPQLYFINRLYTILYLKTRYDVNICFVNNIFALYQLVGWFHHVTESRATD